MVGKDEYVARLEAQIAQWSARIDTLIAKAQSATAEARLSVQREVEECKPKLAAARQRLNELKAVGADQYQEAKETLDSFWKEVKAVFDKDRAPAPK